MDIKHPQLKDPGIDVIIPTFNGMPWLEGTVNSVLQQNYKNFQLYIIDDGSTDSGKTEKYIKKLKDPRIHYHKKRNGGQATARNFGIKISGAPYVTFLDSDDVWYPDKLEKQLRLLEKNPSVGMVYAFHKSIDDRGKHVGKVNYAQRGHLFHYLLGGNKISGSASMVMIRRAVFDRVGLFHEDFLIGEDWEMWLRIAKSYPIDYVPHYLADLRVLDEGMQQNFQKMAQGLEYMLPIMIDEFKLNTSERARLIGTCLSDAMIFYYDSNSIKDAHRAMLKLLWFNPIKFIQTFEFWRWRQYLRIFFANEPLRVIRRTLSPSYRRRWIKHHKKDGGPK